MRRSNLRNAPENPARRRAQAQAAQTHRDDPVPVDGQGHADPQDHPMEAVAPAGNVLLDPLPLAFEAEQIANEVHIPGSSLAKSLQGIAGLSPED